MTETNKKNKPARSGRKVRRPKDPGGDSPARKDSADKPLSEYTPQQRERIRQGLRILAKAIVRAHLRRQAELDGSMADETPKGSGEEASPDSGVPN